MLSQKSVGGELDSLSQSLLSSTVDINPHQIDAALFAFRSLPVEGCSTESQNLFFIRWKTK